MMIGCNEYLEPSGCGDTRRLSFVAQCGSDVVKNTGMIASIADNCFESFAAMFLTNWLGEATYIDQWW